MKPLTFEAVTRDPELMQRLIRQAHRERAEAVYRLVVEPVWSFFARLPQHRVQPPMRTSACG
jgi:hypothetical protein